MGFALDFVALLGGMLLDAAPVLVLLLALMVGLAILIGRGEGWSLSDSIYFGFITGTTVGYGDLRPQRGAGKAMAVVIAYIGLIQIGIIVALAVHAAAKAYEARDGLTLGTLSSALGDPGAGKAGGWLMRPTPPGRDLEPADPSGAAHRPDGDRLAAAPPSYAQSGPARSRRSAAT